MGSRVVARSCRCGPSGACMTFVLVVDDDPAIRAHAVDQPARPRLRGRDGRRRPVGAADRRRADARPGPARPRAARPRRGRGAHAAAVVHAGPGDRAVGPAPSPTTRSRRSTSAPTTSSPSRSAMEELLARIRAASRRAGREEPRPGRRGRRASPRPQRLPRQPRRRGGPPDPDRVADRRRPDPPPRPAGPPGRAAPRGVGTGVRHARPTTSGSTWPSSGASSRPTRVGPRHFLTEPGMGYRFTAGG